MNSASTVLSTVKNRPLSSTTNSISGTSWPRATMKRVEFARTASYSPAATDNDITQFGSVHSQMNSSKVTVGAVTSS
jgi:hypothetical protein